MIPESSGKRRERQGSVSKEGLQIYTRWRLPAAMQQGKMSSSKSCILPCSDVVAGSLTCVSLSCAYLGRA